MKALKIIGLAIAVVAVMVGLWFGGWALKSQMIVLDGDPTVVANNE